MSLLVIMGWSAAAAAQPNPRVTMTVTLPDGKTSQVVAAESALGEVTLGDGTVIGVRPTILDSKPWSHVVVTFFKMPTNSHSTEELGSVEVRTGGAAVQAKTTPALKVAVKAVSEPESAPTTPTTPTTR